jgi:Rrf2 family cysteine metabolism transcriptional repressor
LGEPAIRNPQSEITMRVSAKADYACVAMLELAANHGSPAPVRVKAIAKTHGIPQGFLVQILLQLKAAGLVVSVRGAAGGYQLARSPEDISVADVVHTIDRPLPRREPAISRRSLLAQAIRRVWKDIQAEEQRLLEELTLAELLRRAQDSHALTYQI